jgi:Nickel responsive protein SCO4226-like
VVTACPASAGCRPSRDLPAANRRCLDLDTCAMLTVCRSSWTATSSSASQPRKPHCAPQGPQDPGPVPVRFLTYWFDEERQTAFCLAKAPSADAVEDVHRASHGYMAY